LLDVGHGSGSFDWDVAERALAQGVVPHTISSDLHTYDVEGPVVDLATTVSKFLYLGLSVEDALARVTAIPARTLKREEQLGTLRVGAVADAAVFELQQGAYTFTDSQGKQRVGRERLAPVAAVRGGHLYRAPAGGRG
jgi:dihydroorotase